MDSFSAFALGAAARARGARMKVFDWSKAAKLLVETGATYAEAGLAEDFEWTGGKIFDDGLPVKEDETYTYLSSNWATPVLVVNGEEYPCWVDGEDTEWNSDTYWPTEALAILNK